MAYQLKRMNIGALRYRDWDVRPKYHQILGVWKPCHTQSSCRSEQLDIPPILTETSIN